MLYNLGVCCRKLDQNREAAQAWQECLAAAKGVPVEINLIMTDRALFGEGASRTERHRVRIPHLRGLALAVGHEHAAIRQWDRVVPDAPL